MLVSVLSEDDIALDVVAVEMVGVICPIVLGVFKACVTRNLAFWTALLEPCKPIHTVSLLNLQWMLMDSLGGLQRNIFGPKEIQAKQAVWSELLLVLL